MFQLVCKCKDGHCPHWEVVSNRDERPTLGEIAFAQLRCVTCGRGCGHRAGLPMRFLALGLLVITLVGCGGGPRVEPTFLVNGSWEVENYGDLLGDLHQEDLTCDAGYVVGHVKLIGGELYARGDAVDIPLRRFIVWDKAKRYVEEQALTLGACTLRVAVVPAVIPRLQAPLGELTIG